MKILLVVEAPGIAPGSENLTTGVSTCLFRVLLSPFKPPTDRIFKGPSLLCLEIPCQG